MFVNLIHEDDTSSYSDKCSKHDHDGDITATLIQKIDLTQSAVSTHRTAMSVLGNTKQSVLGIPMIYR